MLIAAVNLILVEPRWFDFKVNIMGDDFSRFNKNYIANIYPSCWDPFAIVEVDKIIRIILSREGLQVPYIHSVLS